jgi:hypothetical protein
MRETFSKKCQDSISKMPTIPKVMAIENRAQRNMPDSISLSFIFWNAARVTDGCVHALASLYVVSAGGVFAIARRPLY